MKKKEKRNRPLTFEEISNETDIPLNQVHKSFRTGYNKFIEGLEKLTDMSIFETVLAVREYFGIEAEEAFRYLNDENKERIRQCAIAEYNVKVQDKYDEDLFE